MQKFKKLLKSWTPPVITAVFLAMLIQTFLFSVVKVQADVLDNYKVGSRLAVNKLSHDYKVGDIVLFDKDKVSYVRKIQSINNDKITVIDKHSNIINITSSDVKGKVAFKVY